MSRLQASVNAVQGDAPCNRIVSACPPALETRVQFTVRSMLLGTTVVAVGVAVVAPWFRQWTAEQRAAFLLTWCNLAVGAGATVAVACVQRVRAERRAGPARYRLARSSVRWAILMALLWSMFLIAYSILKAWVAGAGTVAPGWWLDVVALQYGALFALAALGIGWRADSLELCDAGILRGSQLIPWQTVRGFRWGTFDSNVLILQGRWSITTWRVKPEHKEVVNDFLTEHVQSSQATMPQT